MAKIVYMSDSPTLSTGYGRVSGELATAFAKAGHEVVCIGWGFHQGMDNPFPFDIIPCDPRTENYGEDLLAQVITDEKPDFLFTLGDPWMTEYVPDMEERKAVCWISYFPIDGEPIPPAWHSWLKDIDVPIVFSKFSHKLVAEVIGKDPIYIPHGVNTDVYRPLNKKKELKESILGVSDLFVVGCVARNQPRKNLPALIKAFADFSRNKDDVALYLHTQVRDVGWNIDELVSHYNIADKAFSTSGFTALSGLSDEKLNEVYNLFDIMALPTMAEGFGLPILESQSAGVPVLVTDYSACPDLVVDKQELIKVKDILIMGRNIGQAIADTDDLTRKLNIFYDDWKRKDSKKLKELGTKGRSKALSMDWKDVNKEFIRIIEKLEPETKKLDKTIRPNFYRI
jgi:glycosyltransferase involved in cell wall biosynthesis